MFSMGLNAAHTTELHVVGFLQCQNYERNHILAIIRPHNIFCSRFYQLVYPACSFHYYSRKLEIFSNASKKSTLFSIFLSNKVQNFFIVYGHSISQEMSLSWHERGDTM